jgi:hypothetical protein
MKTLPERLSNGKFPAYAWPGGYPIIYVTTDGSVLCADCATEDMAEGDGTLSVAGADVHYEGPSEFCADCNVEIESAYGDPTEKSEA